MQAMENMIINVMTECDHLKATSVAYPALGTGALKFPPDVTARILVRAVHQYLQGNPNTSITKVIFVIYQDEIVNAFQRELSALLKFVPAVSSVPTGAQLLPPVQSMQASLSSHAASQRNMEPAPIEVVQGSLTQVQVSFN